MPAYRRHLASLAAVLTVTVGAAAKDFEEDARVRDAAALVTRLEALIASKDRPGLEAALREVPPLHNALKTRSATARLQKVVGAVLGDEDQNVMVRKAAADTLGALHDAKGVWSVLKPHVPAAKDEAVGQVGVAVLRALATVQADGAIRTLQRLASSAKDANAARLAIAALGEYSYSKKRVAILEFLIDELTRLRPGNARGPRGRANQDRYILVRDALVAALNRLTRRQVEGVEPWLELHKANKKTPEKLFRTQR